MDIDNLMAVVRRLEIELLCNYQILCRNDLANASTMLECNFEFTRWLGDYDNEKLTTRLYNLFTHNRTSLFKLRNIVGISPAKTHNAEIVIEPQISHVHSLLKTTERKIVSTLREICSLDLYVACGCFGISQEEAHALRNTSLDKVEDWVYSNRTQSVLSLRIKTKDEANMLLNMDRVSKASVYYDRIAV